MRRKSSLHEQSPSYLSLEDVGRLPMTSTIKQAFVILTFCFFISLLISLYGDSKNANSPKNGLYSWLSAKFRTKAENNDSFEVSRRKSTDVSFFLEPYEIYRPNNFYNDFQEQFSLTFSSDIHAATEPDYNRMTSIE
uniref:Uncharacterized protein n=1 Tax=Romanomermis culicivorax TaxID=13658 RepID=A0A915JTD7_ROMCU